MAAGWVSWPWQGQRIITGVLDRRRPAAASGIGMHGACGVSAQGWLSGPLLGCTGRDPLCPASRRQRQIEDNPQRPHAACAVAPNGLRAEGAETPAAAMAHVHTPACMVGSVMRAPSRRMYFYCKDVILLGKTRVGEIGIIV